MKNCTVSYFLTALLMALFVCNTKGDACGGLLGSDAAQCKTLEMSRSAALPLQTVGCGGLISMPGFPGLSTFAVEYKPSNEATNKDHCMWTFDNVDSTNTNQYEMMVNITLLSEGYENSGGALSVVNVIYEYSTSLYVPTHVELKSTGQLYKTSNLDIDHKLFLAYSSDPDHDSGFVVLVSMYFTKIFWSGTNLVYNSQSGQETYGPFTRTDFVAIVVNPQTANTRFSLDYLNYGRVKPGECEGDDTFDIYEISPKSGPNLLKRVCKNADLPMSTSSQYPILATFTAHQYQNSTTFQISWKS